MSLSNRPTSFFEIEIFSSVRANFEHELALVLLMDFGASRTKLSLVEFGMVKSYHTINRGGAGITESISKSLAKASIAVRVNGQLHDLSRVIEGDATIAIVKREDAEAIEMIRHDCAHVLAEAVQSLYPGTQVTIGPNIENGFFYDFARNEPFTLEDLPKIEAELRKIIERGAAFEREVWDREDAIAYFTKKGEMYKAELIRDLPDLCFDGGL